MMDSTTTAYLRGDSTGMLMHGRYLNADALLEPHDKSFGTYVVLVCICTTFAAMASGLTQGLLSLSTLEIQILLRSGTEDEQKYARSLLPIIKNHHLLLVTLMLWNATAFEALPIFLNKLVPEWQAIVISVTLILFCGEIIPSALLTGPNQLYLASKCVPLVWIVLCFFFIIAYPISLLLDIVLGHDDGVTRFNKKQINTLVALQHEEQMKDGDHKDSNMHESEVKIIEGALNFREMEVSEIMTKLENVFMLSTNEKLSFKVISVIFKKGYSRIPIYNGEDREDICGIMLVKDLIFVDPEDETPILKFIKLFSRPLISVLITDLLGETLYKNRSSKSHMFVVKEIVDDPGGKDSVFKVKGIITMEDIIEQILGHEIEDEGDHEDHNSIYHKLQHEHRDMDMSRLKLMNQRLDEDSNLSEHEVQAVAAHLLANIAQVRELCHGSIDSVIRLIRESKVLTLERHADHNNFGKTPNHEDRLYTRNKMANACHLVLDGKVVLHVGKDEFRVEQGAWSVIGADALLVDDGSYIPDFSCYYSSEEVKLLRITVHKHEPHHTKRSISPASKVRDHIATYSHHQITLHGSSLPKVHLDAKAKRLDTPNDKQRSSTKGGGEMQKIPVRATAGKKDDSAL